MRTIVEAARTILHAAKLDLTFWSEAVNTAVYVLNRSSRSSVSDKTPYELWFNKSPDLNKLHVFGQTVYCHIPKIKRSKSDPKLEKAFLWAMKRILKVFVFGFPILEQD